MEKFPFFKFQWTIFLKRHFNYFLNFSTIFRFLMMWKGKGIRIKFNFRFISSVRLCRCLLLAGFICDYFCGKLFMLAILIVSSFLQYWPLCNKLPIIPDRSYHISLYQTLGISNKKFHICGPFYLNILVCLPYLFSLPFHFRREGDLLLSAIISPYPPSLVFKKP